MIIIFESINFGEISTIGVRNFRLGTSSPKLFHTEIYHTVPDVAHRAEINEISDCVTHEPLVDEAEHNPENNCNDQVDEGDDTET